MNTNTKFDLERRLISFAVMVSNLVESLPGDVTAKYIGAQLIRSGLSPALNYGEAKSAESSNDFIHKMKISLKELRESYISLLIVQEKGYPETAESVSSCITECNELICIFVKSIQTAQKNRLSK